MRLVLKDLFSYGQLELVPLVSILQLVVFSFFTIGGFARSGACSQDRSKKEVQVHRGSSGAIAGLALVSLRTLIHSLRKQFEKSRKLCKRASFLKRIGDERGLEQWYRQQCEDSSGDQVLLINSPHCANSTRQQ
ncbi:hypothetical protein MKX03_029019, partial [Papaver bracteatum]